MQQVARSSLQAAVKDYLAEYGPSGFRALFAGINRTRPTSRNCLLTTLCRLGKLGFVTRPERGVYELAPTVEYPRSLIVKATLDHLEQAYGPELAFELTVRGWSQ